MKRKTTTIFSALLMSLILIGSFSNISVNAYDDYEEWYVDPQNPEVQQVIRENCKFPLEDNMWINLQILYNWLKHYFTYDITYGWQTIPAMLRERKGVCCDFARIYYSLLVGVGWPQHRIQLVYGPMYNLLTGQLINWHAWVEIKSPSPSGTILAYSANQSLDTLESEQLAFGLNDSFIIGSTITSEDISSIRSLGWGQRDGWIPMDPTVGVCNSWMPFIPSLFLTFGYHVYKLGLVSIHYNEVYAYYGPENKPPIGPKPRRGNPSWENYSITLAQYERYNISYLHGIEQWVLTFKVTSLVTSTTPVALTIWNPKGQLIDYHWNITNHEYCINFAYQTNPPFPKDLGLYWICVENPWNQTATVTFNKLSESKMAWLSGEEVINQTMYDQYSSYDIGVTDIIPAKTIIWQGYTGAINVTVANYGFRTETFNVTIYANTTTIVTQLATLTSGNSTTITFTWNASGFAKGNYIISAYAEPVPDETEIDDNTFVDSWIIVSMPGDITGGLGGWPDGKCDMKDIRMVAELFLISYPDPRYNPNCDIDNSLKIDIKDVRAVAEHFGETDP